MPSWTVDLPDRLDTFLAKDGRMLSRARAQAAIEGGLVQVNEAVVTKSSMRLQEGDLVTVEQIRPDDLPAIIERVDMHLEILYEDSACFVINKPAGIAVHPGSGMPADEKTILHGIAKEAALVHRLDRETTGCLLIANNPEALLFLQKQFEDRTVQKSYLAIVAGIPDPPAAVIDASIGRSTVDRTKMTILGSGKAREARTTYTTLQSASGAALLQCDLHTGRTHQLRVHLHAIGHPILGDSSYANAVSDRLSAEFAIENLCLHSWKLQFMSPADQKVHDVIAPLPEMFTSTLKKLMMTI